MCRKKTDRLDSCAKETGLSISTSKSQVKSINTKVTIHVNIYGEPLEFVDDLTYFRSFIKKGQCSTKIHQSQTE